MSISALRALSAAHFPSAPDGPAAEAIELLRAAQQMTVTIEDYHLIGWKRGRGMRSSADMSNASKRIKWLRFARAVIDVGVAV